LVAADHPLVSAISENGTLMMMMLSDCRTVGLSDWLTDRLTGRLVDFHDVYFCCVALHCMYCDNNNSWSSSNGRDIQWVIHFRICSDRCVVVVVVVVVGEICTRSNCVCVFLLPFVFTVMPEGLV
jgi:hypothetical protein